MAELSSAQFLADVASASESTIYYTTDAKSLDSGFSSALKSKQDTRSTQLLNSTDPFAAVVESLGKEKVTTVFTNETTLVNSLPHLYSLKNYPVVINVELASNEYSVIPLSVSYTHLDVYKRQMLT